MDDFMVVFLSILVVLFGIFYWGSSYKEKTIKEDYCKHKYEKHIEVSECRDKPFPWEGN